MKMPVLRLSSIALMALISVGHHHVIWGGEGADPLLPPTPPPIAQPLIKPPVPPPAIPIIKPKEQIRLPIPTDEIISGVQKLIKDTYKEEYRARRIEEKLSFGRKLLDDGQAAGRSPDDRFVLLREAGTIAAKNGDLETSDASVKALVKYYLVNENEEYARVYELLVENFTNIEVGQRLALALIGLIEKSLLNDEFTLAQRLSKEGETLGRRIHDNGVTARAKALGLKAKNLAVEFKSLENYQDLLGELTAEGHRRTGLFQCLGKNDWVKGIPHLQLGDDQALAALATLDLNAQAAVAADSKDGLITNAAAEAWFTYAPTQTRGDPREACQARSLFWYRRSLNNLDGINRSKCEKRLGELDKLLANSTYHTGVIYPPGAALLLTFEPDSLVTSSNTINAVMDNSLNGLRVTASGVKPVFGPYGTALEFDGTGRLDCGSPKHLQIVDNLTISMWLWTESLALRQNPINKSYGGEYTMVMETSGTINYLYGINGPDGSPYAGASMNLPVQPKTWIHFVLVRDFSEKTVTWYRNGQLSSSSVTAYPRTAISAAPVLIGAGYTTPFIGKMDDVCIWPRALNLQEIGALYQSSAIGR